MKKIIPLVVIILSVMSINSCKKEKETITISLSTEKSQYAPYEIVLIKTEENTFSMETLPGKINGVDVELSTDSNNAAFVLPDFEDGTYNLSFSLGNKSYNVPIKVKPLTNISSADDYFSEVKTNMNNNISDLSNHIEKLKTIEGNTAEVQALQNDLEFFQNQLNSYSSQFNSLSSEEKKVFAETMAANKASLDEYNFLTNDFSQGISAFSVRDYETTVEISKGKFVASVIYTVGHIPFILAGGKVAAASGGNPGVLLALGFVVTNFMINVENTGTMAKNLTIKSLKPYEFIMESGEKIFQTGKETVENVEVKYRSLINSDGGNSTISSLVDAYNSLRNKYNSFRNMLPSFIRPSYVIASLKNTFTSTTMTVYNQYIKITNINNPKVSLQKINQPDGSIKLLASTDATTEQAFTYDVEYTNGNFASNLKKTVNAKVQPVLVLKIGDNYQGGIICYLLKPGDPGYDPDIQHGKIAAPFDQSSGAEWGCYGTLLDLGLVNQSGKEATPKIVNKCSESGIAARICYDLVLNGYDDWYLPGYYEMGYLYKYKDIIGGFSADWYWASREEDWSFDNKSYKATALYFGSTSSIYGMQKNELHSVRAMRDF